MKRNNKPYSTWAFLVSTFFGAGRIPYFPGTIGSLLAFPLYFIIVLIMTMTARDNSVLNPFIINKVMIAVAGFMFVLGCFASNIYSKQLAKADPGEIIIDEVVAQLLLLAMVMLTIPPLHETRAIILKFSLNSMGFYYILLFMTFVLFRAFDIFKPWPINFIDQKIKGGLGIMLDDLVAAFFAYIIIICLMIVLAS